MSLRRGLVVAIGVVVVGLSLPASAAALPPAIANNEDSVTHFYRNVHYPMASQEVCDAMCDTLRTAYTTELETAPVQTGANAVEGEAAALMVEDGGVSAAGFGAVATPIAVGLGGFAAGYAFGDFINKNFLHIGIGAPAAIPISTYHLKAGTLTLRFCNTGAKPWGNWTPGGQFGPPPQCPEPGYYATFHNGTDSGGDLNGTRDEGSETCTSAVLPRSEVEAEVPHFQHFDSNGGVAIGCASGGGTYHSYGEFVAATDILRDHVDKPIARYTNQSIAGTIGTTIPTFDHTKATLEAKLDDPKYDALKRWLDNKLGGDSDDPTSSTITVPSCTGLGYDACAQRYRDRNFTGPFDHQTATFNTADVNKGAGEVIEQTPSAGSQLSRSASAVIKTNPTGDEMPVVVPSFASAPGEPAPDYVQRLTDAHLTGTVTDFPSAYAPGNVAVASPSPGSRARRDSEVKVITPPEAPDVATGQDDSKCDLESPEGDPGPGDPWQEIPVDPPLMRQPLGGGNPVPVALKRGVITNPATLTGWGYRKIRAKHGWSPWAIAQTQEALLNRPIVQESNNRLRYVSANIYDGRDGARCQRWVIVYLGDWEPGKSPEIVTSYGKTIGWNP